MLRSLGSKLSYVGLRLCSGLFLYPEAAACCPPAPWPNPELMAEWNAYYRNEDEDEERDEGEQPGGEVNAIVSSRVVK